jgi:hypothetical protein
LEGSTRIFFAAMDSGDTVSENCPSAYVKLLARLKEDEGVIRRGVEGLSWLDPGFLRLLEGDLPLKVVLGVSKPSLSDVSVSVSPSDPLNSLLFVHPEAERLEVLTSLEAGFLRASSTSGNCIGLACSSRTEGRGPGSWSLLGSKK